MTNVETSNKRILSKYIPEAFVPYIIDLISLYPVEFKIVRPRKTKRGDFRVSRNGNDLKITVNCDLNPYAFLITTVHEFAHLVSFLDHGFHIAPHGKEWKANYAKLLQPVIHHEALPLDLKKALEKSVLKVKASSCTDHDLYRVLLTYDAPKEDLQTLESLPKNSKFELGYRIFQKGELRRTRFACKELGTQKTYLVNALATVKAIEYGE